MFEDPKDRVPAGYPFFPRKWVVVLESAFEDERRKTRPLGRTQHGRYLVKVLYVQVGTGEDTLTTSVTIPKPELKVSFQT